MQKNKKQQLVIHDLLTDAFLSLSDRKILVLRREQS